jgi:hypothetical protein
VGFENRAGAGGSARGEATLLTYSPQIEADLQHHYRIDLRDLWRPDGGPSRLTHRRLMVLIDHLPGESAFKTAVRDQLTDEQLAELAKRPRDKHGPWSHMALLTAAELDELRMLRRDIVAVLGGKPAGKFEPVPRPGVAAGRRRLGAAQLAHLQRLRAEHDALHGDEPVEASAVQGATVTPMSQEDRDWIAAQIARTRPSSG